MPKLINSSTSELQVKFNNALRATVDMVLMLLGFFAGVFAAWQAEGHDTAVWWGLVAFLAVGFFWVIRAFVIYRITVTRQKAWRDPRVEENPDA